MTTRRTSSGFTLMELLIVVALLGLLSTVAIVALSNARQKARVNGTAASLKQISTMLALYASANGGRYPCYDHTWNDSGETSWAAPFGKWPKNPAATAPYNRFHWAFGQTGVAAAPYSISVEVPGAANALALDKIIDDGNLSSGTLRGNGDRLEYTGFDQSVTYVYCTI